MYAWIWISIRIIYTWFAYIKTKAPPKFCNPWGATSVCEQIDIREKKCNMTCYFTQQVRENMMAKISKYNLKQHMAIKIQAPSQVETSIIS